ncbi:hypothetical protein [Nostoc sp. TCL26-01]|uniref:hypothetical protein n=1 Tax=Nostoc sp. TCL26-01 TaxID=2576904 RepID=UPI0015C12988|nr:hypothetical protein [Nostoc sp. TCL26-01]QLE59914.1 hypothetical protein FD725_31320 [Nostoc sp. TCL26-01]
MDKPIPEKLSTQIDAGVKLAIAQAIERHRRLGESISIWENGQVVTLTAEQIPLLDSPLLSVRIIGG